MCRLSSEALCGSSFLVLLLIIYLWLHWVSVAARGYSPVATSGSYSLLRCAGFSLPYLLLLQSTSSRACRLGSPTVLFSHSVMSDSATPMDCSTAGLPVHQQLPEFTQTLVHWVGDAIQPTHPLSSPSPPAVNLSQHQGFFK